MPDEKGNELADDEDVPETSLHAHDDGREQDAEGEPKPSVGEEGDRDDRGPGNPVGGPRDGAADEQQ